MKVPSITPILKTDRRKWGCAVVVVVGLWRIALRCGPLQSLPLQTGGAEAGFDFLGNITCFCSSYLLIIIEISQTFKFVVTLNY